MQVIVLPMGHCHWQLIKNVAACVRLSIHTPQVVHATSPHMSYAESGHDVITEQKQGPARLHCSCLDPCLLGMFQYTLHA